ncbi:hypothetical protein L1049_024717 [Liquidambar formosana]|uniref:Uncharacterized protein n=1 Tax=Liquidambar formosana TaxID=63359 RepID=A0AAP0RW62_LIQFO
MAGEQKLHIVMFPWLAFGHMIPFLELAKLIAQKGHLAYDDLQQPMTRFLQTSDPDWILYDFAPYWLPPLAAKLGIPCAFFSIFTAAVMSFIMPTSDPLMDAQDDRKEPEHFTVPPNWVPFPSKLAYRYFEVMRIFDSVTPNDSGFPDICTQFEPEWFQLLEELHRKPVIPAGLIPPTAYDGEDDDKDDTWRAIKLWLDKQGKGSVVYVAFGSEAKPSQEELTELALGLELSGLRFFWVLRKRRGSADTELIELPDGFEERTRDRGVVCTSWAPQLKILNHDSVGGFFTHSGWSSVVEATQFERALILLPFLADQGLNTRILEEKKMGYAIPRNERDGSFTRDSVAESLRLVMVEEEGKIYRDKAKEMRGLFGDTDRQNRYLDNFLDYLQAHKRLHKAPEANGIEKS